MGVEPIGGHDLAHHAAVNNLKEQYALLASDGRGTKLNLDTCHCFTLFLLSLYNLGMDNSKTGAGPLICEKIFKNEKIVVNLQS